MLHLVAYDIADPKRLRLVARICENYGYRVEKSVFECNLNDDQFRALWRDLNAIIDTEEDALVAYRICRACLEEIQTAGCVIRVEPPVAYIF